MPDPSARFPLDSELYELGRRLDVPPEADVAAAVRARLEATRGTSGQRGSWSRRVAAVLIVVVALTAAVAAVSPRVRAELFDVLRIGAVQLHREPAPTVVPSAQPQPSWPGPRPGLRSTTVAAARRSAGFPVLVPGGALADPDEVLVESGPRPAYVALLYRPGPGRPPAGPSGVAVQIDEIAGDSARFFQKYLDRSAARSVDVDGAPGVWIDGPHELFVTDRSGAIRYEPPRLAARTLIWQRDGVTLRLEGDLTLPDALAVATGMR
jgi:hypothetical protein